MSSDPMTAADHPSLSAFSKRGIPGAALTVIAIGLSGLGLAAATSDAQFDRGLEQAIAAKPVVRIGSDQYGSITPAKLSSPIAGSEAFWLGAVPRSMPFQPVTFQPRSIAAGDRFQFGGGQGQRILEVTDVQQMPRQELAGANGGKATMPMLIVTLRDVATPQAAPVRMLLDSDAPIAGLEPLNRVHPADL